MHFFKCKIAWCKSALRTTQSLRLWLTLTRCGPIEHAHSQLGHRISLLQDAASACRKSDNNKSHQHTLQGFKHYQQCISIHRKLTQTPFCLELLWVNTALSSPTCLCNKLTLTPTWKHDVSFLCYSLSCTELLPLHSYHTSTAWKYLENLRENEDTNKKTISCKSGSNLK